MSDVNAIQFLSRTVAGDQNLLPDKFYAGSVAQALRDKVTIFGSSMIGLRQLDNGRVAQWMYSSDNALPETEYTPGAELLGQNYNYDEVLISVDKPIVAHTYTPYDEYRQAPFNVLADLGSRHGSRIARELDKRCMIMAAQAARTAAVTKGGLNIHGGGTRVIRTGGNADAATAVAAAYPRTAAGAQALREDMRLLRRRMAEKNHDASGLIPAIVPHYIYEVLLYDSGIVWGTPANTVTAAGSTLFSSDYMSGNNQAYRRVSAVEGFLLLDPVNPSTNGGPLPWGAQTGNPSKYNLNFAPGVQQGAPVLIALAPSGSAGGRGAVGGVIYDGINSIGPVDIETKMSYFLRSHAFCGFGVLDPWMAGSIEVSNT